MQKGVILCTKIHEKVQDNKDNNIVSQRGEKITHECQINVETLEYIFSI